jgi:predicted transcriptional regulator
MKMENASQDTALLVELTAEIVAAYAANNRVSVAELPELIASIHGSLNSLGQSAAAPAEKAVPLVPAVSIKKSITPEYIICLEDGKQFKAMKRHLATKFGMTPDEYRRKWGLPSDYPMVAQVYAAKRSELALSLGLGRKKAEPAPAPVAAKKPARAKKAQAPEVEAA